MFRRILDILILTVPAMLLCGAGTAAARVRGDLEVGYVSYEAEEKGKQLVDAHTFKQRYSVFYEKDGEVYSRRFGFYRAALGYEWASFDSRVSSPAEGSSQNPSANNGKILFDGELVLDPLELPLQFKAYTRDTTRATFTDDSLSALTNASRLITPNITTSLNGSGRNVVTGATMVFGVKNGLTNGYNAIFRHIPMVLLDYRDERHEDSTSQVPVNTRLRKLAFVSLNKRDNWFHYRTTRFDDFINKNQGYSESQIQLGTVDQTLSRRWIDLTNWIKISTDVQYTKRSGTASDAYDVNFFAIANRKGVDARSFLNFSRERSGRELRFERSVPVYLSGVLGADSSWSLGASHRDREVKNDGTTTREERNTSATFRLESFKRSPFTLTQRYVVEDAEANGVHTLGLDAAVETFSTRRFSDRYTIAASYNVRYLDSEAGGGSTYLLQTLAGRASYTPTQRLNINFDETVTLASGDSAAFASTSAINTRSDFGSPNDVLRRGSRPNGFTRSVTTAGVSWLPLPRLTISLTAAEDIMARSEAATDYLTTLSNRIDYALDNLRLNMENRIALRSESAGSSTYFQNTGSAQYTPNRALDALVRYIITKQTGSGSNSTYVDLTERVTYSFYQRGGQARKLVELFEEFTATESDSAASSIGRKRFLIGSRYYPLRNLYVGGNASYAFLSPGSGRELLYTGYAGLNYRKLQINIDYTYAKRNPDNRTEKRLMASMKKSF